MSTAELLAGNATVRLVRSWSGGFRDDNAPTIALTPTPAHGSLLVLTYGGRGHTGDKTPDGWDVAVQSDTDPCLGIFYRWAQGTEESVQLGAGTTAPGTGRAYVTVAEFAGNQGWPFFGVDGTSTGTASVSPATVAPALPEESIRALVVAAWAGDEDVNYADRDFGTMEEIDFGQTEPTPLVVPEGVIFGWPDTAASIPDGWDRVTALDGRHPKGIATNATNPGGTGGAATHSHTTPGHVHSMSHIHTSTGNTGAGSGTVNLASTASVATAISATHSHTLPSTVSNAPDSGSANPSTNTISNDPAGINVIWITPDGETQADGVPPGAIGILNEDPPGDWAITGTADRFPKGAIAAGDGGATFAGASNHDHTTAHTHAGTAHTHTSPNTGTVTASIFRNFAGTADLTFTHAHPVTVASASTATLASTSPTLGSAIVEPPFLQLAIAENGGLEVDLPTGLIGLWLGNLSDIPEDWVLCDGDNGTPDLIDVYVKGAANAAAIGTTGGSAGTHSHTGTNHTHTTSGHTHARTVGLSNNPIQRLSNGNANSSATHTHTAPNTDSTTPTVGSETTGNSSADTSEPLHTRVAFLQFQGSAAPAGDEGSGGAAWGVVDTPPGSQVSASVEWTGGGELRGVVAVFRVGALRGAWPASVRSRPLIIEVKR